MGEGIHTIQAKTDRSHLHNTDGDLNRQEAFRINQLESKIRNRKTEKAYIVGNNGEVLGESVSGSRSRARLRVTDLMKAKDAIMTHNHPNAEMGGTLAAQIGLPFSHTDLERAVEFDMKEIRAVTPNYTYSIRRPEGGWGDKREVMHQLSNWNIDRTVNFNQYINSSYRRNADRKETWDRANVGGQWAAWRKTAKALGWTITRKKVK